jgi:hypothetical protein
MTERPRIDLDGVSLADERNPHMAVAIFRHRTTEGLVLLIPESAELTVPWSAVEAAELDLKSGALRIRLAPTYVASRNWLRGAVQLVGTWTDRFVMPAR